MSQLSPVPTAERVSVILAAEGWSRRDIDAALAIVDQWGRLTDVMAIALTQGYLRERGRTVQDCLFFLRVVPHIQLEQVRTMLTGAPVVFAAQTQVSGINPDQVEWLWGVAEHLGMPEDGFDAAGWVHAGVLVAPDPLVRPGRERVRIEKRMRPWLDALGPGAWRWQFGDPLPPIEEAVDLSQGWAADRESLDLLLGLGGRLNGSALVAPPPLGYPPRNP